MLDKNNVYLGIAPIAWTNDDLPDLGAENTFEQCISEMALAGYQGCEIGCKYPKDREELKKALDLRNIQICNRWFSSFLISKPFEETATEFEKELDFLQYLGAKVIGVSEQSYSIQGLDQPVFENRYIMNESEWQDLTNGLNRLGEIANKRDMHLTFHHHMGTVIQTEEEIDRLLAQTNPNSVSLLFDSGHLFFDSIDPTKILKKHVQRVKHVHLKDVRKAELENARKQNMSFLDAVRSGAFTVPGDGSIAFEPLFDLLDQNHYKGWLVVEAEQDPAKANPFEYALKGRNYIREKTSL